MAAGDVYPELRSSLLKRGGTVMLIGGPDTGKTTFSRRLLADAIAQGIVAAYVDADVGQTTTGPPACAGLRFVRSRKDLDDLHKADELRFVGSTSPDGLVLQQVVATAALVERARQEADFVVVDTTGSVSGVIGQTLKYHKVELVAPDTVVALQRGREMEPIIGMLRRFFGIAIETVQALRQAESVAAAQRRSNRIEAFTREFAPPLQKWRVLPTVFAPTLPAGLDLSRLHGILVGLLDDHGRCLGLGILEHDGGTLRVATNKGDDMKGLRLASLRIDPETFATEKVRLRQLMFGV
jgi:polynucleotide 5'-kinase involved in rRNA processing